MIFRQIDEILAGRKTQTRRVCKPGEFCHGRINNVWISKVWKRKDPDIDANVRLKWAVGRTYAIVPKRGQPGLKTHRIRITAIRQERVQEISEADAIAEGCSCIVCGGRGYDDDGYGSHAACGACADKSGCREDYRLLWDSINTRKGVRWEDNPLVWVIEFECVEVEAPA